MPVTFISEALSFLQAPRLKAVLSRTNSNSCKAQGMGTLTADVPRLAEHCQHKLPSSCRLTATPLCCACYDRRPHSTTYSVYVDGVGFVQRGTRWQNYCWFCKTFWENRVAAADIPTTETRIPEDPDQTEFIERWFEFYQGYRLVKHVDRREDRVAVVGEPFKEVSPGHLPRTVEELRRGASLSSAEIRLGSTARQTTARQSESLRPVQSLEDTLGELLREAIAEEEEETRAQEPETQPLLTAPSARTNPSRRRLPSEIPTIIRPSNAHASSRMRDRLARIFGTPEEIQSDEYVSPIAGMFNRAWERHRRFQELRRAQEDTGGPPISTWWVLDNENFPRRPMSEEEALIEARRLEMYRHLAAREGQGNVNPSLYESLLGPRERHSDRPTPASASNTQTDASHPLRQAQESNSAHTGFGQEAVGNEDATNTPRFVTTFMRQADMAAILRQRIVDEGPEFPGLDGDDRPEPLDDSQLTVKLECKICLSQLADTACLPCGHLSMCGWCADQAIPVREYDRTRPRNRHAKCPVCRKGVKQRAKIYAH